MFGVLIWFVVFWIFFHLNKKILNMINDRYTLSGNVTTLLSWLSVIMALFWMLEIFFLMAAVSFFIVFEIMSNIKKNM